MKTKFLAALVSASVLTAVFMPAAFASFGPVMPAQIYTNSQELIYIKKPESCSASTSDKTYTLSAVGTPGTVVSIYKYDPDTDSYVLIRDDIAVGSSGLYSMAVDLDDNSNIFRVFAQNGAFSQSVDIEINKIKQSTIDKLKGISVTIRDFFN